MAEKSGFQDGDRLDFSKSNLGQNKIKKLLLTTLGIIATSLSSLLTVVSGQLIAYCIVYFGFEKNYSLLFTIISITAYIFALGSLIFRGFKDDSIILVSLLIILNTLITINQTEAKPVAVILFMALSIVIACFGAIIIAHCISFTYLEYGGLGKFFALLGAVWVTVGSINFVVNASQSPRPGEGRTAIIAAIAAIITGAIIARQAIRGSPKFAWIREKVVFWAATSGTSFYGLDLTDACFDGASLPHTDFRKAILTRASFEGVTGLDLARLQGTILDQPKVRKLITNKIGCDEDYTGLNFNGASLRGADLTGANLTEVQALDADFTGAILTDACIQGWNINKNTCFKDVICKRVYLRGVKKGNTLILSEPKPDSGEFKPGEFEKWIGEIQNTVDLIFREGLNWRAFMFSLAQTAIEHEGLDLSRYDIARKDENIVFAKIGLFPGADNTAIHEAFQSNYEYAEKAIEAKYQLILQAKDSELERLRTFAESNQQILRELMSIAVGTGRQILVQGESHKVYLLNQSGGEVEIMEGKNENTTVSGDMVSGNKTTSGDVTIGDVNLSDVDLKNSSMALVNLNSQVSNTIQQLQDVSTDKSDELAKILTDLQKSIADDAALSESQKKEALEAVETIAEEGKKPPEERVVKYCSMAVNALKGVASALTDASKLAEVLNTYLPHLSGLLGIN